MAKGHSTMVTYVGNQVQDTGSPMAALIGQYLNEKYHDISHRTLWNDLIDWDKTLESTATTAYLTLTDDFEREIAVVDIANGHSLKRHTVGQHWMERATSYQADAIPDGNPVEYIVDKVDKKLYLIPTPDTTETYAVPYQIETSDLLTTTAPTIDYIDWIMELGAIGEAWAYKRQFQKANFYLNRYEVEVRKRVGQEKSKMVNQLYQFTGPAFGGAGRRIWGGQSYDDL